MPIIRVPRHGQLDLEFDGELIAESDSDDGIKARWQHFRLYRKTADGKYILERLGESRLPGEVCMRYVDEINTPAAVRKSVERKREDGSKYLTIIALELLDQAASNDDAFKAAVVERI